MQKEWDESYEEYFNKQLKTIFTINETPTIGVKEEIQVVSSYNDGFAVAKYNTTNSEYFYVNANNNRISDKSYEEAKEFIDGVARVRVDGKWTYINEKEAFITIDKFDAAYDFANGEAVVAKAGKYNRINTYGHILYTEWYNSLDELNKAHPVKERENDGPTKGAVLDAEEKYPWEKMFDYTKKAKFTNGIAPIKMQVEEKYTFRKFFLYNFIYKTSIEPISEIWFTKIHEFIGDYAVVERNIQKIIDGKVLLERKNKYSLLCKNGKLFVDEWFDDVSNFVGDYARLGDKYVDKQKHFYDVEEYPNGVKKLTYNGESIFIKESGVLLNNKKYAEVGAFNQGFAYVKKLDGKYNYIDRNYHEVSITDFNYATDFDYGRAVVSYDNKYFFIDTNFNKISEKYDSITAYGPEYAIVELGGKYSIVDNTLNSICTDWYDSITKFNDGYARVEKDGKFTYIDMNGDQLVDEWYAYAEEFNNGCALVGLVQNNKNIYNLIDRKGHEIFSDWSVNKPTVLDSKGEFTTIKSFGKDLVHFSKYDMGDYQVKKGLTGYKCTNSKGSFVMKREPVKMYSDNYFACRENNQIYLYDRRSNSYNFFGPAENISIKDNLLVANVGFNYKAYLLYDNEAIDISDYYTKNLRGRNFTINQGYEFLTKDEFFRQDEDKIRERYRENTRKQEEKDHEKVEKDRIRRLADVKRRQEVEKEELEEKKEIAKYSIAEAAAFFREYEEKTGKVERVEADDWLIDYGAYKVIHPTYVEFGLKNVDLSQMPIKDVIMKGLDFHDSNISITGDDPLHVFNKDLSGCNFEGVFIPNGTIFTGVNICGAKFSRITNGRSMGISELAFEDAIYDEYTTVDGIPLVELLKEEKHNRR
jgi:hypothetical protein